MLSLAISIANKAIDLRYLAIITSYWLKSSQPTTAHSEELRSVQMLTSRGKGDLHPVTIHIFNNCTVIDINNDLKMHLNYLSFPVTVS